MNKATEDIRIIYGKTNGLPYEVYGTSLISTFYELHATFKSYDRAKDFAESLAINFLAVTIVINPKG